MNITDRQSPRTGPVVPARPVHCGQGAGGEGCQPHAVHHAAACQWTDHT